MTRGDLFITKPGEIHGTGSDPEHKGRLYWLELRHVEAGRSFLGLSPQESDELMRRFLSLPSHHFRNGDVLAPILERIFSAHADIHNPLRTANVKNLLLRFVLDVIALAEDGGARPYSVGVRQAIREIGLNKGNMPDIKQLASVAGMSESYFKVIFKKETGIPPVEYAMRRRIEKAKHMLCTSARPITRLAMDLGFATSQHFSTTFKRLTGLTPRAYRQSACIPSTSEPPLIGAGPDFHPS